MALVERLGEWVAGGAGMGGGFFAVRWVVMTLIGRADRRQQLLDDEHAVLDMSWKDYRLHLEQRFKEIDRQNQALRLSFEHVAGALIRVDPQNPALALADRVMAQAFPMDFTFSLARVDAAIDPGG